MNLVYVNSYIFNKTTNNTLLLIEDVYFHFFLNVKKYSWIGYCYFVLSAHIRYGHFEPLFIIVFSWTKYFFKKKIVPNGSVVCELKARKWREKPLNEKQRLNFICKI